jgi:hypothetical protein
VSAEPAELHLCQLLCAVHARHLRAHHCPLARVVRAAVFLAPCVVCALRPCRCLGGNGHLGLGALGTAAGWTVCCGVGAMPGRWRAQVAALLGQSALCGASLRLRHAFTGCGSDRLPWPVAPCLCRSTDLRRCPYVCAWCAPSYLAPRDAARRAAAGCRESAAFFCMRRFKEGAVCQAGWRQCRVVSGAEYRTVMGWPGKRC